MAKRKLGEVPLEIIITPHGAVAGDYKELLILRPT